MQEVSEKCAVFGIFSHSQPVSQVTHAALWSLQHRGQEASGMSVANGKKILTHKALGLVTQVYTPSTLEKLQGHIAIGHNRYATSGDSSIEHVQPVFRHDKLLALAHNGTIPDTQKLEKFLHSIGSATETRNDSEMIADAITFFLVKGVSIETAVKKVFPLIVGAYALVILTKDKLLAVRDPHGIRPLCLGTFEDGGVVVSSENCAFPSIGATFVRDVAPGEMLVITQDGIQSILLKKGREKLDIFEFVYFARADSSFMGKRVNEVRRNFGKKLAQEAPVPGAEVILAVPDSAFPAAEGFSEKSGVLVQNGFIKNGYVHRTFIRPEQYARERHVHMKLNPIPEVIAGKRVVLIDDSIVRGTTTRHLVKLLRNVGAAEVHIRIASPPVLYPDFYGIDTPRQSELLAATHTLAQITKYVGADSVAYLSYSGMIEATQLPESKFCTSCFTGKYPIPLGKQKKEVTKVVFLPK